MSAASDHPAVCLRAPYVHGWADLSWIAMTDRRDAIRIYPRLGLHSILLHGLRDDGRCTCHDPDCVKARGKHPVHTNWQTAALDIDTLDRALISNWRLNIGLRMGRQPGGFNLITIDVDGPLTLLAPLEAKWGKLPATLTARTGSGGQHLIFRVSDEALGRIKNKVKLSDGVDVRSSRGQIVVAPSKHYSGNHYEWIDVREPAVLP